MMDDLEELVERIESLEEVQEDSHVILVQIQARVRSIHRMLRDLFEEGEDDEGWSIEDLLN